MVELHDVPNTHFDMNHSGVVLSWNFFHPGKEPPKFLKYIEDRDLWKWELPYSKEFSAAFDMVPFDFEEFDKFKDESVIDDAISRGGYILAYSKTVLKKIGSMSVSRNFMGHSALVVNASHWMSEIGATLSPNCDVAIIWYYSHKHSEYKVSLRSFHDHGDCSELAKKYGGGGHKKAAGFAMKGSDNIETLFEKKEADPSICKRVISKVEGKNTNAQT
jgi:oligoribonuclease NrnB/cAMP/cGMP phosphodiesterase (DHH superfamily)